MDKPTQEQLKEFWEWCGLKIVTEQSQVYKKNVYLIRDSRGFTISLPKLDFNNLFKYAPEPLMKREYVIFIEPVCDANFSMVGVQHIFTGEKIWKRAEWIEGLQAIIDALFWAIWEVIKDGK